jgi:ATPase subunit of ABC transporter with duplicated ATPase domains
VGQGDQRNGILSTGAPLLDVRGLVAGYAAPIVGPVSFAIARGEVIGLRGANGSGKTTVFNALVGAARVFEGQVVRTRSMRLAFLRQRPVRLPEMPLVGRELLRLTGADGQAMPERLKELVDVRLDRLSGGQYQLLQVWACLASPVDLVLLDEPTNNMDASVQDTLGHLLIASRHPEKGVLVISHEHEWLERICTRTVGLGR